VRRFQRTRAALLALAAVVPACAVLPATLWSAGSGSPAQQASTPARRLLFDRTLGVLLDPSDPDSLSGYWSTALHDQGVELEPPMVDGAVGGLGGCRSEADTIARYCAGDHSIRFDADWLEALHATDGPGPVAMVLGHAFGHLVQAATATPLGPWRAELQADCYAGMYLGHLVRSGRLSVADVSRAHRSSYLVLTDPPNGSATAGWTDPVLHGPWTARRQALGVGYDTASLAWCRGYDGWSDVPPIELGAFETLTPGPVLSANVDARGELELRYPDALVRLSRIDRQRGSVDAGRGDLLRAAFGDASSVATTSPGTLGVPGWSRGDGQAAAFEVRSRDGEPSSAGIVALRLDPAGTGQLFVAQAPVSGTRQAAVEAATRALRALLWGRCDLRAPGSTNCAEPLEPDATPTPPPVASPTPSPTPAIDVTLSRRELEQRLVTLAPAGIRDRCRPYRLRGEFDPFAGGALAAVDCRVGRGGVDNFALFQFPDADSLRLYFDARSAGVGLVPDSGGCLDGTRGETAWDRGRVACWVTRTQRPRLAHLRWTDDEMLVYGVVNGTTNDLAALAAWWFTRQDAGPEPPAVSGSPPL
jgi:hypothetical protein